MGRRRKRKAAGDESDDEDAGPVNKVLGRKNKVLVLDSESEDGQKEGMDSKTIKRLELGNSKVKSQKLGNSKGCGRKVKIVRCAESSEDEQEIPGATPKIERMKKLEEMRSRVSAKKAKKKVHYSSSSEASDPGNSADEEDLPMWENEEAPPEDAKVFVDDPKVNEDSDLEGFVVSDGNEEADAEAGRLPDSEDDETAAMSKAAATRRKKSAGKKTENSGKSKKRTSMGKAKAFMSDTEDNSSSSEETEGETEYVNPYMAEDKDDILARLRRDTTNDRKNKKNYKREVGKYQFECHTSRNKAAALNERVRFARNMETAKFDRGLKEERNLDWGDSEFYDYKEVYLFGEAFRLYPHNKRITKYSSRCAASGCRERFQAGETKVIGAMKLDPFSCRFVKKISNWTGKECFYYVCAHHYPKGEDSSDDEWPSDISDDQIDDASDDEEKKKKKR